MTSNKIIKSVAVATRGLEMNRCCICGGRIDDPKAASLAKGVLYGSEVYVDVHIQCFDAYADEAA
jgi:hypothetical protein